MDQITPPGTLSFKIRFLKLMLLGCVCLLNAQLQAIESDIGSTELKRLFREPPRQFSTGPLWVWNDMLTDEQIRSTLRDLAEQKIQQVWVHPRPGLMTPYLGEEWFRLWEVTLDEAAKLGMNVWIYDENSYPSGFAGGWVPELMPESRGRGLEFRETNAVPAWNDAIIAVYALSPDGNAEDISNKVKSRSAVAGDRFLIAGEIRSGNSPWHGNRSYVNLLSPGVTEKFLEVTMEPYRKRLGKEFGKRIPGVFTDEPNIRPAGGFPWSEVLLAEFKKRWGYDLLPHLPSLARPIGDWRKIRHNYFQVLHEQFVEHWAKPYYNYCETNNLQFTGHYWDHEWPNCMGVPDNMAMYAWHQLPAIDCLMNQYQENTHAQFGNIRMVKELSSVANQMGWKQTLCEIYGAGGWDLRFEDMKRIGDWLEVLGVNVLNQHLSYVTIRGARKRDHPQSFSYHAPWWKDYHLSADYFARLSTALTHGEQINPVLVIEPTTTAWMYQGDAAKLRELGDGFFALLKALEAAQIEYDLGSEDIIRQHGRVQDRKLVVGKRSYKRVVVPPFTETLDRTTHQILTNVGFLTLSGIPPRIDGALPKDKADVRNSDYSRLPLDSRIKYAVSRLKEDLLGYTTYVERPEGDKGILFHHRRVLADGELLFLVNTSLEEPSSGVVVSQMGGAEDWDLYRGVVKPYPFAKLGDRLTAKFELPPSGSLMLFLPKKAPSASFPALTTKVHAPAGEVQVKREEPNVLTLDYVNVTAGGETRTNIYFYQANQFVWQKNGMKQNPWDSAVQFKSELIDVRFPENTGFEAAYNFRIEGEPPADLAIVIERPDLYTIRCNGKTLHPKKDDWWLDKAFGRMPIAKFAREGLNTITLHAAPFTIYHELEPAYLLGNFSLRNAESGFVVTKPQSIQLAKGGLPPRHVINPDGTMWLSGGIWAGPEKSDRAPFVVFDLGREVLLVGMDVWNYNENHVRNLTGRGVRRVRILTGESAIRCEKVVGEFDLARGTGMESEAQRVTFNARKTRFVKLEVLSNHAGVEYPVPEGVPADNGYVGLAEVQMLAGPQLLPLKGTQLATISSELPSHNRLARYLVDRSGLAKGRPGWNSQGHPFYSAGVSYTETFNLGPKRGRYLVSMPEWYGSVARVKVNGKPAGHIDAPPWECDISSAVRSGDNEVSVTIVGTPKNLLGPHHGSPVLGSAWPGNFQHAPNPGPPPGQAYSTVGYGLFAPFVVKQLLESATPGADGVAQN